MAYVVTDACIRCQFMECTTVCPVNCFYEGATMVAINQEQCIDCGSCEPICPAAAILPDIDDEDGTWAAHNTKFSELWPRIKARPPSPPDGAAWQGVPDKMATAFDPAPAARPGTTA